MNMFKFENKRESNFAGHERGHSRDGLGPVAPHCASVSGFKARPGQALHLGWWVG
jgi:hypothetical protein